MPRHKLLQCGQCTDLTIEGTVDPDDGIFYCFSCWEEFGGIPETAQWMNCVLCKKSFPPELFSKTQQKKKKPICEECMPRRVKSAGDKNASLNRSLTNVNKALDANISYSMGRMFTPLGNDEWKLQAPRHGVKFEALVGVNNLHMATLGYRHEDKLWEVKIGDTVQNFWQWPAPKNESFISDFAFPDTMRVYSLGSILNNLSMTFILSPSSMYDVRKKYTKGKVEALFEHVLEVPRHCLSKIWWPVQIFLEDYIDCPEATSNLIVDFTGEVLMECTFTTAQLGALFMPWDTWEVDLDVMGTYEKMRNLAQPVAMTTEKGLDSEIKTEVLPCLKEKSQADAKNEAEISSDVQKDEAGVPEEKIEETERDSVEIVEAPV